MIYADFIIPFGTRLCFQGPPGMPPTRIWIQDNPDAPNYMALVMTMNWPFHDAAGNPAPRDVDNLPVIRAAVEFNYHQPGGSDTIELNMDVAHAGAGVPVFSPRTLGMQENIQDSSVNNDDTTVFSFKGGTTLDRLHVVGDIQLEGDLKTL